MRTASGRPSVTAPGVGPTSSRGPAAPSSGSGSASTGSAGSGGGSVACWAPVRLAERVAAKVIAQTKIRRIPKENQIIHPVQGPSNGAIFQRFPGAPRPDQMTLTPLAWSLLLGTAAAAANVLGGVVVISRKHWNELVLKYFIALGAGFMLAATCLRMIPESLELSPH